jgi:hypothetical protein
VRSSAKGYGCKVHYNDRDDYETIAPSGKKLYYLLFDALAVRSKTFAYSFMISHSTNNTKHSKYKYTYYQNTHTYTHSTLQNKFKTTTVQVKANTVQDISK